MARAAKSFIGLKCSKSLKAKSVAFNQATRLSESDLARSALQEFFERYPTREEQARVVLQWKQREAGAS